MSYIFVSYRREDSADVTGRIFDHLKARFGEQVIFKDVHSIELGDDFPKVIADSVRACRVLVAIIGKDWLTITNDSGQWRIDDPADFVRLELETAFDSGVPVVPVLVENQPMPKPSHLPDSLKQLASRNAARVRADPDFESDFDRLAASLERFLPDSTRLPILILAALAAIFVCLLFASALTDLLPAYVTRRMLSFKWTASIFGSSLVAVAAYIKWRYAKRLRPDIFAFLGALVAMIGMFAQEPSLPSNAELERLETVLEAPGRGQMLDVVDAESEGIASKVFRASSDPYQLGLALLRFGDFEEALGYFQAASRQTNYSSEKQANVEYYRGNCLFLLGRYEDALEAYDAALKHRPGYVKALNNKGLVFAELGKPKSALSVFEEAIRIDPSFPKAWFNKASILSDLGRFEESKRDYKEGKRLWPTVPYAWNYGVILRICVDRSLDSDLKRLERVRPLAVGARLRAVFEFQKRWVNGSTLTIEFVNGDRLVQQRVEEIAAEWNQYANLRFEFVNKGEADIRISFDPGPSWSYIGTDATGVPEGEPTMNFGWLTQESTDDESAGLVLHQFGHALGFVHEHQSPEVGIAWDEATVYRYYAGPPNFWNKDQVDRAFLSKYQGNQLRGVVYDDKSIMRLPIPSAFTLGNYEVGWNTSLSAADKEFVASADGYPGRI